MQEVLHSLSDVPRSSLRIMNYKQLEKIKQLPLDKYSIEVQATVKNEILKKYNDKLARN